jgi:hypothetical protein
LGGDPTRMRGHEGSSSNSLTLHRIPLKSRVLIEILSLCPKL